MSWWNRTRLAGLRAQLTLRLRRWWLPFWAVLETDLASLVRGWMLRAWLVLTTLAALVVTLDHSHPHVADARDAGVVVAILHPAGTAPGAADVMRTLLGSYVVIWVTFVILLAGGTISSELGVVADSVLSRGVSRWQYFLGKLAARLTAVLGVYAIVMVPVSVVVWLEAGPARQAAGDVLPAMRELDASAPGAISPAGVASNPWGSGVDSDLSGTGEESASPTITFGGLAFALTRVAAVLVAVVAGTVASSASFRSTIISIAVAWVSLHGTGVFLSLVDLTYFAPARVTRELPALLAGQYLPGDQLGLIAAWLGLAGSLTLVSGTLFARRDV